MSGFDPFSYSDAVRRVEAAVFATLNSTSANLPVILPLPPGSEVGSELVPVENNPEHSDPASAESAENGSAKMSSGLPTGRQEDGKVEEGEYIRELAPWLVKREPRLSLTSLLDREKEVFKKHVWRQQKESAEARRELYARIPSNEGLYEPKYPVVGEVNIEILASRLARESEADPERFFDEQYFPAIEYDPVTERHLRPLDQSNADDRAFTDIYINRPIRALGVHDWLTLSISLDSIKFTDHPLFTEEDLLATEVEEMYAEYRRRMVINLKQFYRNRIATLEKSATEIRARMIHANRPEQKESARSDLIEVLEHLLNVYRNSDIEEGETRRLVDKMYRRWLEIKNWRDQATSLLLTKVPDVVVRDENSEEQNHAPSPKYTYAGTKLRLMVKKSTQFSIEKEKSLHDRRIKAQVEHLSALHRLKGIQSRIEHENNEEGGLHPFEKAAAEARIRTRMEMHCKPAGEPEYEIVVDKSARVMGDEICCDFERRRRKSIRQFRIHMVLKVNGRVVCRSPTTALQFPGFNASLKYDFDVKVLSIPQTITCEVYQDTLFGGSLISKFYVGVPHIYTASTISQYDFSSSSAMPQPESAEQGPSKEVWPIPPEREGSRFIQGRALLSVAWKGNEEAEQEKLAMIKSRESEELKRNLTVGSAGSKNAIQFRLSSLIDSTERRPQLDSNDPRNMELLELIRRSQRRKAQGLAFRAEKLQGELALLDSRYYIETGRRQVLRSRQIEQDFAESIPFLDSQIPERLYDFVPEEEDDSESPDPNLRGSNPFDLLRKERMKLLKNQHSRTKLSDVVREELTPQFFIDSDIFERIFAPRRKLRPRRIKRETAGNPDHCRLVIQIIRGQNFPVRRSHQQRMEAEALRDPTFYNPDEDGVSRAEKSAVVRSFVEVSFQENYQRTSATHGCHPRWNETIVLPLRPPNGSFAPRNLLSMKNTLMFNVFDEVTTTNIMDDRQKNTRLQRKEKRWLGSFSIPITTIYTNTTIDGHFIVQVPLLNLEYDILHPQQPTVLYLFVTLDPPLAQPPVEDLEEEWARHSRFLYRCIQWTGMTRAIRQCHNRTIQTVGSDIAARPVFLPNFIGPILPPMAAEDEFVRFVSRIPFEYDIHLIEGAQDIWCSCSEFLQILGGDWEEHAVLLCNYFLYSEAQYLAGAYQWQSYVVLGRGIPEGDTAYVMRNKMMHGVVQQTLLYNAVTGRKYEATDSLCPLVSIGCIFNHQNLWANIQETDDPARMTFQLSNPRFWRPLFDWSFKDSNWRDATYTQQPSYRMVPEQFYNRRAQKLERIIEQQLTEWRTLPTYFDHGISQILREALQGMEFVCQGRSQASENRDIAKVRTIYKKIYGFPLNFTDAGDASLQLSTVENPAIRAIYNTRLHESDHPDVKFARAVYIYPYPNGVGSVWVYVASVISPS